MFVSMLKQSDLRRYTVNSGTWKMTERNTLFNNRRAGCRR